LTNQRCRTLRGIATLQLAARWMARGSNDPTLWAVIRRGSSLLGPEDMGRILPFLAPGLPLTIHQVAIQAVESKSTIAVDPLPKDVTDRVAELAQPYVNKASWRILERQVIAAGSKPSEDTTSALLLTIESLLTRQGGVYSQN